MKISKLYVENFRSIKGPFVLNFSQMNALVGQNNTGKSNILLAIQKVLGSTWVTVNTFDENDVYLCDPELDIKIALDFDPPISYQMIKEGEPAEITTLSFKFTRYKIGAQKGERRLEKECFDSKGRIPQVLGKSPRSGEKREYKPVIGIPQEIVETLPLIYIGANRELKDQLPSNRYSLLRTLLEDIDKDFRSPNNKIKVTDSKGIESERLRSEMFQELMTEAVSLLHTEEFKLLEKSIKENALRQLGLDPVKDMDKLDFFFSSFSSADFYKSLKLLVREKDFTIDATELGGGIQNALVMSILKAFEERRKRGAIFLIEEPEMYLHPQMQRSLFP